MRHGTLVKSAIVPFLAFLFPLVIEAAPAALPSGVPDASKSTAPSPRKRLPLPTGRDSNPGVVPPLGTRMAQAETEPEAKPAAEAAPVAQATPAPTPQATPVPTPFANAPKVEKKKGADDPLTNELKGHCNRHYPGLIQSELRTACVSAADEFSRFGKQLVQTRCRLNYGEEPRLTMACLVGATIADDVEAKREDFKKKLQLCAEHFPVHIEIDAFLQESCITGIHLPELMKTGGSRFDTCAQITPEKSFIGPCAVGLSLASELAAPQPGQQNLLCKQYFDHRQFHAYYRACLNSRSLAPDLMGRTSDALKNCEQVVGNPKNETFETERAACLVGASIYKHLAKQDDLTKRFQKCGEKTKVSYQDRDFLACLTAASLLDFTDKSGAEGGCKEVFQKAKGRSRGDCLNSLSLF